MPELPEVEVVRAGLARWMTGTRIESVDVLHPRPVRRHQAGAADFAASLAGTSVVDVVRRGKFLWCELDSGQALLAHLGMSGQLLLRSQGAPDERHLRVRLRLAGGPDGAADGVARELRFIDQRMFGGLAVTSLVPTPDDLPAGRGGTGAINWTSAVGGMTRSTGMTASSSALLPPPVLHVARDVLDPLLHEKALVARLRARHTAIKRALLDQTLVSGIGNIYADEALWRARMHGERPAQALTRPAVVRLLGHVRAVMTQALAQGGTSFDALYVNVNGESGYFERSLAVYGREGLPCRACGTPVRREAFMNRSSFSCPRCQPRPRPRRDARLR